MSGGVFDLRVPLAAVATPPPLRVRDWEKSTRFAVCVNRTRPPISGGIGETEHVNIPGSSSELNSDGPRLSLCCDQRGDRQRKRGNELGGEVSLNRTDHTQK